MHGQYKHRVNKRHRGKRTATNLLMIEIRDQTIQCISFNTTHSTYTVQVPQ